MCSTLVQARRGFFESAEAHGGMSGVASVTQSSKPRVAGIIGAQTILVGLFDAFTPMFFMALVTTVTSVNAILFSKPASGAEHGRFLFSYD